MDEKFVRAVTRKVLYLKKEDPYYNKGEIIESMLSAHISKMGGSISEYDIAFYNLFQNNEKLNAVIDKHLKLLSSPEHYRQDISNGVTTMIRELRLPDDQGSEWQLLYETLVHPGQESGPILHLFFDGWDITRYQIYYWDESAFYDI